MNPIAVVLMHSNSQTAPRQRPVGQALYNVQGRAPGKMLVGPRQNEGCPALNNAGISMSL